MEEYGNLSPRVKSFVERYIDSFIAWDLALFFRDNPYAVGSADSLAPSIGRGGSDLQLHLEKLADQGVLSRESSSEDPGGPSIPTILPRITVRMSRNSGTCCGSARLA